MVKDYKKILRIIMYISLGLILCFLIIFYVGSYFMFQPLSDEKIQTKVGNNVSIEYLKKDGNSLRYVKTGDSNKQPIIFIHGAPGNFDGYIEYLSEERLLEKAQLISLDRPGYGLSDPGNAIVSIEKQADIISGLFDVVGDKKPILIGYSYGGPIVARMIMDYPEKIAAGILIAAPVDPKNENIFSISYFMDLKYIKPLIPQAWRVTNDEKLAHVEHLEYMEDRWSEINHPITVIQGGSDNIVPPSNGQYLEEHLINADLKIIQPQGWNHMLIWEHYDEIVDEILYYL